MAVRSGLINGTILLLAVTWLLYATAPSAWPGLSGAVVQTVAYLGNVGLTLRYPWVKVVLVRAVQRWVVNPVVRALFAVGINPLGLALLETRGRRSGRVRRVPVGNGRTGDDFWIVAEHGLRAGYVRNILAEPTVRVRLRVGLRYRWLDGVAEVLPGDDPIARQRRVCRWHPLRAFNAANVRVLGAELISVRVRLVVPAPVPTVRHARFARARFARSRFAVAR